MATSKGFTSKFAGSTIEVCPVVNFRVPKLVDLYVSWPGHPVIEK